MHTLCILHLRKKRRVEQYLKNIVFLFEKYCFFFTQEAQSRTIFEIVEDPHNPPETETNTQPQSDEKQKSQNLTRQTSA